MLAYEQRVAGRHRVDHPRAAAGDDEAREAQPLLVEELLLAGHEVLAVHERRHAVRGRDGLALRAHPRRPSGEREARAREACSAQETTARRRHSTTSMGTD